MTNDRPPRRVRKRRTAGVVLPASAPAVRRRGRRPEPYARAEVLARWAGCCYCDGPAEELDHVIPLSQGGADVASNIVAACQACNQAKYTKPLAEWAAEV